MSTELELHSCPFCRSKSRLTVSNELGDTSRIHRIECEFLSCLTIQRCLSYYQSDYAEQLNKLKLAWNEACCAIETHLNKPQE